MPQPLEVTPPSYALQELPRTLIPQAGTLIAELINGNAGSTFLHDPSRFHTTAAVGTENGSLMGVSCVRYPSENRRPVAVLNYLAVATPYQKKLGIGRALLEHVEQEAATRYIRVISLLAEAEPEGFYIRHGYGLVGQRQPTGHNFFEKRLA